MIETVLAGVGGKEAMPQVIYKPHCHLPKFSQLANGVYFIAIINKILLCNGNCPITNLIT